MAVNLKYWIKRVVLAAVLLASASAALAGEALTPVEQRKLNTFFSNFSEAWVENFTSGSLSDEAMLQFALRHNYLNNYKSLKPTADHMSVIVSAEMVDHATQKYFARTISKHKQPSYTVPNAEGDPVPFSKLKSLKRSGDDVFLADGAIYVPDGPDGGAATETSRFTALIKKVHGGDGDRWVLLEYTVNQPNQLKK